MATKEEEYEWMEEGNKRLKHVRICKKRNYNLMLLFLIFSIFLISIIIITSGVIAAKTNLISNILSGNFTITIQHSISPETLQELNQTIRGFIP